MSRELLFTVTKKDFTIQTFRSGGPGGQNQNKVNTGVRLIHRASGAIGEARDQRTQEANKRNAFLRCINTPKFKAWSKIETMRRTGELERIERKVDELMQDKYIKVEYYDPDEQG